MENQTNADRRCRVEGCPMSWTALWVEPRSGIPVMTCRCHMARIQDLIHGLCIDGWIR